MTPPLNLKTRCRVDSENIINVSVDEKILNNKIQKISEVQLGKKINRTLSQLTLWEDMEHI